MGVICACEQRNDDLSVVINEIESNRTRLFNEIQKTSNQKDESQGRGAMKRMTSKIFAPGKHRDFFTPPSLLF